MYVLSATWLDWDIDPPLAGYPPSFTQVQSPSQTVHQSHACWLVLQCLAA